MSPRRLSGFLFALLLLPALISAQAPAKAPKATSRSGTEGLALPAAISGMASSGRQCIGPSGANVHVIGWVPANSRVTITFSSDFDPVAAATIIQMGQDAPDGRARSSYWFDDDGGGNMEPELRFTTGYSGTLALNVSKYSAERSAGCYFYKLEIITG